MATRGRNFAHQNIILSDPPSLSTDHADIKRAAINPRQGNLAYGRPFLANATGQQPLQTQTLPLPRRTKLDPLQAKPPSDNLFCRPPAAVSRKKRICARCLVQLGRFFNTGSPCPSCGDRICSNCRIRVYLPKKTWLCVLCVKERQLHMASTDWTLKRNEILMRAPLPLSVEAEFRTLPRKDKKTPHVFPPLSSTSFHSTLPRNLPSLTDPSDSRFYTATHGRPVVTSATPGTKKKVLKKAEKVLQVVTVPVSKVDQYLSTGTLLRGGNSPKTPDGTLVRNGKVKKESVTTEITVKSPVLKQKYEHVSSISSSADVSRSSITFSPKTARKEGHEVHPKVINGVAGLSYVSQRNVPVKAATLDRVYLRQRNISFSEDPAHRRTSVPDPSSPAAPEFADFTSATLPRANRKVKRDESLLSAYSYIRSSGQPSQSLSLLNVAQKAGLTLTEPQATLKKLTTTRNGIRHPSYIDKSVFNRVDYNRRSVRSSVRRSMRQRGGGEDELDLVIASAITLDYDDFLTEVISGLQETEMYYFRIDGRDSKRDAHLYVSVIEIKPPVTLPESENLFGNMQTKNRFHVIEPAKPRAIELVLEPEDLSPPRLVRKGSIKRRSGRYSLPSTAAPSFIPPEEIPKEALRTDRVILTDFLTESAESEADRVQLVDAPEVFETQTKISPGATDVEEITSAPFSRGYVRVSSRKSRKDETDRVQEFTETFPEIPVTSVASEVPFALDLDVLVPLPRTPIPVEPVPLTPDPVEVDHVQLPVTSVSASASPLPLIPVPEEMLPHLKEPSVERVVSPSENFISAEERYVDHLAKQKNKAENTQETSSFVRVEPPFNGFPLHLPRLRETPKRTHQEALESADAAAEFLRVREGLKGTRRPTETFIRDAEPEEEPDEVRKVSSAVQYFQKVNQEVQELKDFLKKGRSASIPSESSPVPVPRKSRAASIDATGGKLIQNGHGAPPFTNPALYLSESLLSDTSSLISEPDLEEGPASDGFNGVSVKLDDPVASVELEDCEHHRRRESFGEENLISLDEAEKENHGIETEEPVKKCVPAKRPLLASQISSEPEDFRDELEEESNSSTFSDDGLPAVKACRKAELLEAVMDAEKESVDDFDIWDLDALHHAQSADIFGRLQVPLYTIEEESEDDEDRETAFTRVTNRRIMKPMYSFDASSEEDDEFREENMNAWQDDGEVGANLEQYYITGLLQSNAKKPYYRQDFDLDALEEEEMPLTRAKEEPSIFKSARLQFASSDYRLSSDNDMDDLSASNPSDDESLYY